MRGYACGGNGALKEVLESGKREARGRRGGGCGNFHYFVLPLVGGTRRGSRVGGDGESARFILSIRSARRNKSGSLVSEAVLTVYHLYPFRDGETCWINAFSKKILKPARTVILEIHNEKFFADGGRLADDYRTDLG